MNNAIASALQTCEEPGLKEQLKAAGLKSNAMLFLGVATYNRVAGALLDDLDKEVKVEMDKRKKAREGQRAPSKPTK